MRSQRKIQFFWQAFVLLIGYLLCLSTSWSAANPHAAFYSPQTDKLLWFIQASDSHIGAYGTKDSTNLQWLAGDGKNFIQPSFIVVTGDLTDSTNGNIFGYPNGPYQAEWDQYKSILGSNGITRPSEFFFDLPGNHDAYNDKDFRYFLANSIQGKTQAAWTRNLGLDKYLFVGTNTAGNTGSKFSLSWPYGDYAGLDTAELDFIGQKLSTNGDAILTLIFGHHPLAATGDSTDTYLSYGKNELVSFMQGYGTSLYGYGHTHASSEGYYSQGLTEGVFYFNVAALGKDSPNQYAVTAIDCNGISSVTQNVNTWPVVLITAPLHRGLGGVINPYAYPVPNSSNNPIRALVFDKTTVTSVQFRVNGGTTWYPMSNVAGNPKLWQGIWDASSLSSGEYTIEVQAVTGSGTRSDTITTSLVQQDYTLDVGVTGSGMVTRNPDLLRYTSGTAVTLTATPNPGWVFSSWSGDLEGSAPTATLTMNGDKTVSAVFVQQGFTLTTTVAGSGMVTRNPDLLQYTSGTAVTLTATPNPGWVFSGWSGDLTGSVNPTTVTMNGNRTVTATFVGASSPGMHIGAITVTQEIRKKSYRGIARVRIVDANNFPVSGALVSGRWSGGATDSDTFTTGTDGWGSATSNWRTGNATFSFCVNAVSKTGWSYYPAANVATCLSTP